MTDIRRVLENAGWNLGGSVVPLIAAAGLVPFIINRMGIDRFGLLSLVWVLIGYFSLFDLGLGRALTKMIAERKETVRGHEIESLTSTGVAMMCALGLGGGLLIASCVPLSFGWLARLPPDLTIEARNSLFLVSVGIPLVVAATALKSVLEGVQAFRVLNFIRAPAGVLLFAAPALSSVFSARLDVATLALVVARALVLVAHIRPCLNHVRIRLELIDWPWIMPMLRFGGWLTVSSVIGPLIVYLDRFVLGIVVSASAVAYYAAPFEMVSRLLIVPAALAAALFPAMVRIAQRSNAEVSAMRRKATKITLLLTLPICLLGAALAKPILGLWLGSAFAENSAVALQFLLPGFAFNSVAQIPLMALYGVGHTRPVALMHLVQLPLYAILLYWMVTAYGIPGAAAAWSLRAALDWLALSWMLRQTAGETA